MLSWTVGGYPSINLRVAHRFARRPHATAAEVLDEIATEAYGSQAAPHVRRAWTALSNAFRQYPYHGSVMYLAPQQMGPANRLFARPTGYKATMVGLPYDDLQGWRGPYPAETLASQFQQVSDGWLEGLKHLQRAVDLTPADLRPQAQLDLQVARAAQLNFASVANQVRFVLARDALLREGVDEPRRARLAAEVQRLLQDEAQLARELFLLARDDSRIGFEASNHYFYVPLDLVEKLINCEYLKRDPAFAVSAAVAP
jgi:hypothetical protein